MTERKTSLNVLKVISEAEIKDLETGTETLD